MNTRSSILEDLRELASELTDFIKSKPVLRLIFDFVFTTIPWLLTAFFLLRFLINIILSSLNTNLKLDWSLENWVIIVIVLIIFVQTIKYFILNVEANTAEVYAHRITAKLYPMLPGFNFISPLQKVKYTYDTKKDLEIKGSGDAEVSGGVSGQNDNMSFKWVVLFRVNPEVSSLRKYAETTEANVIAAITLKVNLHIIDWLYSKTADEAKKQVKQCLTRDLLEDEEFEFGIKIQKIGLVDLDFSAEVRELRKGQAATQAFNAAMQVLIDAGIPKEEALNTTKALMLKGNFKEVKLTGSGANNVFLNT